MATADQTRQRYLAKTQELEIDKLFRALVKLEGSDLHLKVGTAPVVRVHGTLRPLNREPIDTEEMVRLIFPMLELQERRKRIFDEDGGVDFAHTLDLDGKRWRFRVNVLQQMGQVGMVARRVNNVIPDFEHLSCLPNWQVYVTTLRGWFCWRASPVRARARQLPRCST